jgi:hypothetical protein
MGELRGIQVAADSAAAAAAPNVPTVPVLCQYW